MPDPSHVAGTLSRAWYGASIAELLQTPIDSVVGRLAQNSDFTVLMDQTDAWVKQIEIPQRQLAGLPGSLFLEFSIPQSLR